MKDRFNQILEILTEQQRVEVCVLAERLGVSQVTVRKDLESLESRGILRREHGWASLCSTDDIGGRLAYHYEIKQRIASKAVEMIHDGETLMIESGSCCALLSDAILQKRQDVTIITNSAFIADYVRHRPGNKVILLGGYFQGDSQVTVGPMVKQNAKNFLVDKLFIGTDGYAGTCGFTNSDQLRAQAVRDMEPQAEQVIVLTESIKFHKHGVVPLQLKKPIGTVITDDRIPPLSEQELAEQGTLVVKIAAD